MCLSWASRHGTLTSMVKLTGERTSGVESEAKTNWEAPGSEVAWSATGCNPAVSEIASCAVTQATILPTHRWSAAARQSQWPAQLGSTTEHCMYQHPKKLHIYFQFLTSVNMALNREPLTDNIEGDSTWLTSWSDWKGKYLIWQKKSKNTNTIRRAFSVWYNDKAHTLQAE